MVLSASKALDIIQGPLNRQLIEKVKIHESALRVYTQNFNEDGLKQEPYFYNLEYKMQEKIGKSKTHRVFDFARYPLPVINLTKSILKDFFRVYEGKDRNFNVTGSREIDRLKQFITVENLEQWIETKSREVWTSKPNAFVVLDRRDNGEVYPVFVDSDRLIDTHFKNSSGDLEYIVFVHSFGHLEDGTAYKKIAVYDDNTYRVFYSDEKNNKPVLESESVHGLGFTPAHSFLSTATNQKNYFFRQSAFSSSIADLEYYAEFSIYDDFVDYYSAFPIIQKPGKKCEVKGCKSGFIESVDTQTREVGYKECPSCKKNKDVKLTGPGSELRIHPQRLSDSGKPMFESMRDVLKLIYPDSSAVKIISDKLEAKEWRIRFNTVGTSEVVNNEAINEMQVKGTFATRETVLIDLKTELDKIYIWIVKTAGALLYPGVRIDVDANFGTEFYLSSETELQEKYKRAKEIGLPREELKQIYLQIIDTKYKGNKTKIERQKLLLELNPYQLFTTQELIDLATNQAYGITPDQIRFAINFNNYISRFEREIGSILIFGTEMQGPNGINEGDRIKRITEILNIFNNEANTSEQLDTSGSETS